MAVTCPCAEAATAAASVRTAMLKTYFIRFMEPPWRIRIPSGPCSFHFVACVLLAVARLMTGRPAPPADQRTAGLPVSSSLNRFLLPVDQQPERPWSRNGLWIGLFLGGRRSRTKVRGGQE